VAVRVDDQVFEQWKGRLGRWKDRVDWVVVDGFLMFWDQVSFTLLYSAEGSGGTGPTAVIQNSGE
jgi:hypothetical protein